MLKIEQIKASYGENQILHGVSLEVKKGEVVAVIGPNGAGKTTLMKVIMGFLKAQEGRVIYKEQEIQALSTHQIVGLKMTLIMEGRQLFPKLSVLENLLMGSYLPQNRPQREAQLNYVYSLFPILESRQKQMARTLSGGESQMLAVGRALMSQPEFLILDEPSLGLAPKIVENLFDKLQNLQKEGLTLLIVEQHAFQALQISQRAYVLESGQIALTGSAQEISQSDQVKKAYLGL